MASARFSEFPAQCVFCAHVNPRGAKFCNDCGAPLHLKPCRQCEAINDRAARRCYKCGIEATVLEPHPGAAPGIDATEDIAAPAAPANAPVEAAAAMPPVSDAHPVTAISPPDDNPETIAHESDIAIAVPRPSLAGETAGVISVEIAPEARAPERRPRQSHRGLAGLLSAVAVVAVAIYVYRADLLQPGGSMRATAPPATARVESPPAKIEVAAAAEPVVNDPSASATSSPLPHDEARVPAGADGAALTSGPAVPALPSPAQPATNEPAPPATPDPGAPAAAPITTAEARESRAAPPSPVAKKSTTNAKTTAKKAKRTSTKKAASPPGTPTKAATTTETPKSAE